MTSRAISFPFTLFFPIRSLTTIDKIRSVVMALDIGEEQKLHHHHDNCSIIIICNLLCWVSWGLLVLFLMCLFFFGQDLSPFTSHKNSHNSGTTLGSTSPSQSPNHIDNYKVYITYNCICEESICYICFYIFGFRFEKQLNYTYPKELRKNFAIIAKETIAICKMVHINVYSFQYFLVMKPY
jgi:hypothetical protein